jgi:hypothetical protein
MQYLVTISAVIVSEWNNDPEDLAANLYAQVCELAFSEDHLLQLEVLPVPLPKDASAFTAMPAPRNDFDQKEGGEETLS